MKSIAITFSVFILGIIILADRGQLGALRFIYDIPYGDKVGHFVLFGFLNFFISSALVRALPRFNPKLVALSIAIILALLIGAEEYSQKYFTSRTVELLDLIAGYLGVVVGGFFALKLN